VESKVFVVKTLPFSVSLISGQNLLFPEVGYSPLVGKLTSTKAKGKSAAYTAALLKEMEWAPDLPLHCF